MKTGTVCLSIALAMVFPSLCPPAYGWEYVLNPNSAQPGWMIDTSYFKVVAIDGADDVIACGTVTFSDPPGSYTVVKVSGATGQLIWIRSFEVSSWWRGRNECQAVSIDSNDDVLTAGYVRFPDFTRLVVYKFSGTDGSVLWSKSLGEGEGFSEARGMAIDQANDAYVVGDVTASHLYGSFVIKFSGVDGTELWRTQVPEAAGTAFLNAVRVTASGDVLAGGVTSRGYVLSLLSGADGGEIWRGRLPTMDTASCALPRIVEDGQHDILVHDGGAVTKVRGSDGLPLWSRVADMWCEYAPPSAAMSVDGSGDVLSVKSAGSCAVKFSGVDGSSIWKEDPCLDGRFTALGVDAGGAVVAAGQVMNSSGSGDFSVLGLSGIDGSELWRRVVASPLGGSARAVTVDARGNPVVGGWTRATSGPDVRIDDRAVIIKLWGRTGVDYPPSTAAMLDFLRIELERIALPEGVARSLQVKLDATSACVVESAALCSPSARNDLKAFTNEIEALRGKMIVEDDAAALIDTARELMAALTHE